MIQHTLDTIDMNTGNRDNNGALWFVTDSQGWFDGPDMRQMMLDRSTGHGSLMAMSVMDKRRIQLSGVCRVQGTEANIWRSREKLVNALTTFTEGRVLTVYEYGAPKQVTYFSTSGASIRINPGGFEWDVTLVCEDPRKFSPVTTTLANVAQNANTGAFATFGTYQTPAIVVANVSSVTNTGNINMTFSAGGTIFGVVQILAMTIAATDTRLVLDVMNRQLYTTNTAGGNVTNRFGSLNAATAIPWPELQAGANNRVAFAGTVAGITYQTSYRDAWL